MHFVLFTGIHALAHCGFEIRCVDEGLITNWTIHPLCLRHCHGLTWSTSNVTRYPPPKIQGYTVLYCTVPTMLRIASFISSSGRILMYYLLFLAKEYFTPLLVIFSYSLGTHHSFFYLSFLLTCSFACMLLYFLWALSPFHFFLYKITIMSGGLSYSI